MKCCLKKHESDLSQFSLIFFFSFVNVKNVFSLTCHIIGLGKQKRNLLLPIPILDGNRTTKGLKVIETLEKYLFHKHKLLSRL